MDEEIAWAVDRARFQQQTPVQVQIMNPRRNARGTITTITHQHATTELALLYRDISIKAARSVETGIIEVQQNVLRERQKILTIPLLRYTSKGTEGLQKI